MQQAFYKVVQSAADRSGKEMTPQLVVSCFQQQYYLGRESHNGRIELCSFELFPVSSTGMVESPISESSSSHSDDTSSSDGEHISVRIEADISVDGEMRKIAAESSNSLAAFAEAIKTNLLVDVKVKFQSHHDITEAGQFASFFELHPRDDTTSDSLTWGVGIGEDKTSAKLHAFISGINSIVASGGHEFPKRRAFRPVLPYRRSHTGTATPPPIDIPMRTGSVGPYAERERQWRRPEVSGLPAAGA